VRLTKLQLHGFKSFADATDLVFDQGCTAIVGPNGCGKSNVSDAVRWVLGEQRARALRGAKMEEVIFQGSSARRPVNLAEVSLHFDNSAGEMPIPFGEVVITRRLSRSGESEYLLNNQPCRLRDIHDLLRGTGLGADAGVVIESKMIDALLSDRPDERRELFEEAAGVSLYRDRRRTTARRLEETAHDLQRIDDLLVEKTTLVRSLARQRKRAEQHAELMRRRLALELTLAEADLAESAERLTEVEAALGTLRGSVPDAAAQVETLEAERDEAHRAREAADARRNELARLLTEQRDALATTERQLAVADAEQRGAMERRRRAEAERESGTLQQDRVVEQVAAVARERAAADAAVADAAAALAEREAVDQQARAGLLQAREALQVAERAIRQQEDARRRLELDREATERERGELAERLARLDDELPPLRDALAQAEQAHAHAAQAAESARTMLEEAEAAFAAARTAAVAARDEEGVCRAVLRDAESRVTSLRGKTQALEQLDRERVGLAPAAARLLKERERFGEGAIIGPLADHVTADSAAASLVERFLGATIHAVVVRDQAVAEAVRAWHAEVKPGALLLLPLDATPELAAAADDLAARVQAEGPVGRWVRALLGQVRPIGDAAFRDGRGAVWLPGGGDAAGPLQRRAELASLREELQAAERAQAEATRAAEAAGEARALAERTLREAQVGSETAARERAAAEARAAGAEAAVGRARRLLGDAEGQHAKFVERRQALAERLAQLEAQGAGVDAAIGEAQLVVEAAQAEVASVEQAVEAAREARTAATVAHAEAVAQRQVIVEREQRLAAEGATYAQRLEALARELQQLAEADDTLARQLAESQLTIESRRASLADVERQLTEAEAAVRGVGERLVEVEHALDAARHAATAAATQLHHAELEHRDLSARRSLVRERLEAEWRRPLAELYEGHEPVEGEIGALRAEAEDVRGRLEALGLVNPLAVEEHAEEQQRLDFLQEQRADLAEAQRTLQQAIREIDATARELFLATFTTVRENFRQIFLTLFGGGECDLRLADPSAPLECDIEVHASPRGKKTQRIHLLSSGERALVALSLLFGIFLTKPSPFCLLDEVDAPLDDANIGRFVRMINEFKMRTQFIVITHNPRTTTEAADAVYGVTMQEPGVSSLVSVRMRGPAVDTAAATATA
jgi:chromosome segregation protein